jgi:hypothetical protein
MLWALAAGVVVAAGMVWFVARRADHRPPEFSVTQMAESLTDAADRHDTERVMLWATRVANVMPRNSAAIRVLGVAWHNYGTYTRIHFERPRPALRTSLDRIENEIRVLACMDSAARLAQNSEEWVLARGWVGNEYEYLGLPIDALAVYENPAEQRISFAPAQQRAVWLRVRLSDPLVSDGRSSPAAPSADAESRDR